MALSTYIGESIKKSSWIRRMFTEGQALQAKYGKENVFDLSLGNPVLEPPPSFFETLADLSERRTEGLHRYMPNPGYGHVREAIANFLPQQTRKLKGAIAAVYDPGNEPMMLLLGNSSYVYGITHPTPVWVQDAYFEFVKSTEWAGLMWWIFEDFKDSIGGRHYEIIRSHQRHGERIRQEKLY